MKNVLVLLLVVFFLQTGMICAQEEEENPHAAFEELQKDFKSGPEVTKACLGCHEDVAEGILQSRHWLWKDHNNPPKNGKTIEMNNFCISVSSNEPRCTSCHIGFGWKDKNFDHSNPQNIDCLVCHDGTKTYKKFPTGAGHPVYKDTKFGGKMFKAPDLKKIAQSAHLPDRDNCGACHFYGGGGNSVKHGNLDNAWSHPTRDLDVHMGEDGENMTCNDCHKFENHNLVKSGIKEISSPDEKCIECHSEEPHNAKFAKQLNKHVEKIACQTCHIPEYGRGNYTKVYWDWSKAGKFDENGKMIIKEDEHGNHIYHTLKGEFRWAKNALPEYTWWNGDVNEIHLNQKIDPSKPVVFNEPLGGPEDGKIFPFKIVRGKQPYDAGQNLLATPKLFGPKGSRAYWKDFDWEKSLEKGMEYNGIQFSGKVGFVESKNYMPVNHGVAPKEKALSCKSCHSVGGRMSGVTGVKMPLFGKKKK